MSGSSTSRFEMMHEASAATLIHKLHLGEYNPIKPGIDTLLGGKVQVQPE